MVLVKDTARKACGEILLKLHPLISEKFAFGCALFSNVELDIGTIQKTIIASFATFAVQATDTPVLITRGQRVRGT